MSLYGALFGGVSGLRAQSSKIGVISDNIANSNTIGYKRGTAVFQSLVINSSNTGAYQTGGVRGGTQMNISQQGLLQSTNSSTDIAISGGGFFVVRNAALAVTGESSSTPYYTRAGSFTQDSRGNFVNSAGFFLQGWPLDREGRLPGEVDNTTNTTSSTNFDSIETVNVESASGVAQATSTVSLGANLKSSEAVFAGSAGVLVPDATDTNNRNLPADQVVVGSEYGLATSNDLRRGDSFNIATANGASTFTFEYGGYTVGRNINSGTSNTGDGNLDNTLPLSLAAENAITYDDVGHPNSYLITIPNHGLLDGEEITLAGISAASAGGAGQAAALNTTLPVERVDANTVRVTIGLATGGAPGTQPAGPDPFTADVRTGVFNGNIFNATSASAGFLNNITGYSDASKSFTITSNSVGTRTFTYVAGTPNAANGEFNSLNTLASAINAVDGLTARVVNGRLVAGSEDANEPVQFANGDAAGGTNERGLDWVGELDLQDIEQGTRRFNSLGSLAEQVNAEAGISATLSNPLSNASLSINVDSPLQNIVFSDLAIPQVIPTAGTAVDVTGGTYAKGDTIDITVDLGSPPDFAINDRVSIAGLDITGATGLPGTLPNGQYLVTGVVGNTFTFQVIAPADVTLAGGAVAATAGNTLALMGTTNQGSIMSAFGILGTDSLNNADYYDTFSVNPPVPSATADPRYSASGVGGQNMASGDITAQFSRNVRIYDAQGFGHDIRFSYIKSATNTWEVEVHAIPASDISAAPGFVDGQLATGTVTFNGDGTLQTVSSGLQGAINVTWTNGSSPGAITLDLGTAGALGTGLADGLSQFASGYNVNFANQDGAPVGQLVSVSINTEGQVIASYSNGQIQALYQLPLADFANPDGLIARSGNIFEQTSESGEVNLREANSNGTGTIVSGALEQSNVDIAEELTDMIVAQRAYQANTRVIKTTDELLDSLNQI